MLDSELSARSHPKLTRRALHCARHRSPRLPTRLVDVTRLGTALVDSRLVLA